jgi:hypothetical protein
MDTSVPAAASSDATSHEATSKTKDREEHIKRSLNELETDVRGWVLASDLPQTAPHVDHAMLVKKIPPFICYILLQILKLEGMELKHVNDLKRLDRLIQETIKILNKYGTSYASEVNMLQYYAVTCRSAIRTYEDVQAARVACDKELT